jgi:hypothetical protein
LAGVSASAFFILNTRLISACLACPRIVRIYMNESKKGTSGFVDIIGEKFGCLLNNLYLCLQLLV